MTELQEISIMANYSIGVSSTFTCARDISGGVVYPLHTRHLFAAGEFMLCDGEGE